MPIAAVPKYLAGQDFSHASPALRFNMYFNMWDTCYRIKPDNKLSALRDVAKLTENDKKSLSALLQRQQAAFVAIGHDKARLCLAAQATAPFTTGLGNEHPLKNGFAFLNPYGLPYLPGSGVKGVLRQAARELSSGEWADTAHGWTEERIHQIKIGRDLISLSPLDVLFGLESVNGNTQQVRGALSFWDVIPQIKGDSLAVDVMTPHQGHFYQQTMDNKAGDSNSPHDSGTPFPINFLTIPAGANFTFHVTCDLAHLERLAPDLAQDGHWKSLLTAAFEHAFEWLGFGAKTAVGYGAMQSEAQREQQRKREEQSKEREKIAQQEAARKRQAETAVAWQGARIKFNRGNGSLMVEKDGKNAIALAPTGKELLDALPTDIRKKVESNQFVKVTAFVAEGVLVRIEVA